MNQGDILVVLKPRWHEANRDPLAMSPNKRPDSPCDESIIKVHSFTIYIAILIQLKQNQIIQMM